VSWKRHDWEVGAPIADYRVGGISLLTSDDIELCRADLPRRGPALLLRASLRPVLRQNAILVYSLQEQLPNDSFLSPSIWPWSLVRDVIGLGEPVR
jgi:hypothetical protein